MKVGDRVKLIEIPPNLRDEEDLPTRTLFEKCLGRTFRVEDLETVEGLPYQLAKLNVGHVLGEPEYKHTIWVEPEYLQVESQRSSKR
jgi:hypothetical protein